MLPENLDITQQLFECSQQIQQMFTHMSTMERSFTESVYRFRVAKSTGDGRVMLTLAAKGTSPITESETTSRRGRNLSISSVSEPGRSHQGKYENTDRGEYENTARVHTGLTNLTTPSASRQDGGDNNSTRSSKQSGNEELAVTSRNEEWKPLPMFNEGSCADCWAFKCAFQSHIREDGISECQKLGYLIAAYSGPAKQELCGCQELEDPKEGYKETWNLLEIRHGDKRTYIQQLIKGVCGGPIMSVNDIKGLRLFADALSTCLICCSL
ncbi:hypothetical protein E2C01_071468 [Portunus trituberculatus]|uniref:Uncharacterized protein n=1 Tax=Portunus trituberculatus TaxID=210409 RepID=A0A5B7I574_PORTR|nr:hypothetical protein [Portunus trituberculatus]